MIGIGKTDIGKARSKNEDSIFVKNSLEGNISNLYIVADGMGGHKAGSIASSFSIKYFCEYIENNCFDNEEILDLLVSAVKYSNEKVYKMSLENSDYSNMGTTFLACTIKENMLYIAHIGDCRLYLIRQKQIAQITTDHTYVMEMVKAGEITYEQARNHPNSNVVTRALGIEEDIIIDGLFCRINDGDIVLLCSDGLSGMVTDNEILQITSDEYMTIEEKVDKLIDTANNNGGRDNISVIIIG